MTRLKNISKLAELAALVATSEEAVRALAFETPESERYRAYPIPKRNGTFRFIQIPSPRTKRFQRNLLPLLEEMYRPHVRSTAYRKGYDILKNASFHKGKRLILNIDLEDFFGQITVRRLYGMLRSAPYDLSNSVATTILNICTYQGALPQGAPTSPILANMLCSNLDTPLAALCKRFGCSYSRYSDDITISTNRRKFPRGIMLHSDEPVVDAYDQLGEELLAVFSSVGFEINKSKVRLLMKHDRQEVTGIVLNQFPNPRRNLLRQTRQMLAILEKYGEDAARNRFNEIHPQKKLVSYTDSVRGRIEYIKYVRGNGVDLVANLVSRFNHVSDKKISYKGKVKWFDFISAPVVCLENAEDVRQGTAFHLGDGYFLTNHHVVHMDGLPDRHMKIVSRCQKYRLRLTIVHTSASADLSIIKCSEDEFSYLLPTESLQVSQDPRPLTGAELTLVGYPNWTVGSSVHVDKGMVSGYQLHDSRSMLRITPKVAFGNSGGPVVDQNGLVIGVATVGADIMDDTEVGYLAVPCDDIRDFLLSSGLGIGGIKG